MAWQELEDEIVDAISHCCQTDVDKEKALTYFTGVTVNELIIDTLTQE